MERYGRIQSVTFGQTPLPLPLSVRVSRRAEPMPAAGQEAAFATSVQIDAPVITAEVRLRGIAVPEGLSLGQRDTLSIVIDPTRAGQAGRSIMLAGAVLVAVETVYEQTAMAAATLRFVAEADQPDSDPFAAEDQQ